MWPSSSISSPTNQNGSQDISSYDSSHVFHTDGLETPAISATSAATVPWLDTSCYELHEQDHSVVQFVMRTRKNRKGRKPKTEAASQEELIKRRLASIKEKRRADRMKTALDQLKLCLPDHFHTCYRPMSKVKTLRLATSYIAALGDLLNNENTSDSDNNNVHSRHNVTKHPINLSSPPNTVAPPMDKDYNKPKPLFILRSSSTYNTPAGHMYSESSSNCHLVSLSCHCFIEILIRPPYSYWFIISAATSSWKL